MLPVATMTGSKSFQILPEDAEARKRIWLMLLGLAAIAIINIVMALLLSRSVADRMLLREAEVAQEFLISVLNTDGSEGVLFAEPTPSPALLSFANHLQNLPDVIRANIYSSDGFIRYSTEKNLIGVKFAGNRELENAFGGKLSTLLEEVTDNTKPEHLALNRTASNKLVETYVPVYGKSGNLACVVEFYRLPTRIEAAIADVSTIIWLASAVGALILFLAFYMFFIRTLPESAQDRPT